MSITIELTEELSVPLESRMSKTRHGLPSMEAPSAEEIDANSAGMFEGLSLHQF